MRPHGFTERGSLTWHRAFKEGTATGTAFVDGIHNTGHLGGYCGERRALQIRIVPIAGNEALKFFREAFLLLANGDL